LWISDGWTAHTGQAVDAWIAGGGFDRLHVDDQHGLKAAWQAAVARGEPFEHEFRLYDRDGELHRARAYATPARAEDGHIREWLGIYLELGRPGDTLLPVLDADRRRDEFLAILAHELRNPLAPLRSGLELLERDDADERAKREVRHIMRRQLWHITRLVDDLIDASRITAGKLQLQRQHVNLCDALLAAIDVITPAVHAKHQQLHPLLPAAEVFVSADPVRLTQVFTNILNNAVRHAPIDGNIWVNVSVDEHTVQVRVEDDGIGIPEGDLQRIFEMFVQSASGQLDAGMGVGLALVKGLVEMHGGTVQASNRPDGRGARFTVRFPVVHAASNELARASAQRSVASTTDAMLRVLVVDDNRDAAEGLATLIELDGHVVQMAGDGPSAVDAATTFRPHVIFMDLGLPGFGGLEATRRIRALDLRPVAHIVALTGWGQESDRDASAAAGCDEHLVKPAEFDTIQAILWHVGATQAPPHEAPDSAATRSRDAGRSV
jgi:two-component system CheB/CheR fusion protein